MHVIVFLNKHERRLIDMRPKINDVFPVMVLTEGKVGRSIFSSFYFNHFNFKCIIANVLLHLFIV